MTDICHSWYWLYVLFFITAVCIDVYCIQVYCVGQYYLPGDHMLSSVSYTHKWIWCPHRLEMAGNGVLYPDKGILTILHTQLGSNMTVVGAGDLLVTFTACNGLVHTAWLAGLIFGRVLDMAVCCFECIIWCNGCRASFFFYGNNIL